MTRLTANEKKGLYWIGVPALVAAIGLGSYFLFDEFSKHEPPAFLLGIGGVGVFMFLIGLLFAAHYVHKDKALFDSKISDNPIYNGLTPEQVTFIKKNFWSPFFHPICWAVGNRLYLFALESIIPIWGTILWLRLIFRGGTISWEQGGWKNFQEFKQRQKNLAWITLGIVILSSIEWFGLLVLAVLAVMAYRGLYSKKQKPLTPPDAPLIPPTAPL